MPNNLTPKRQPIFVVGPSIAYIPLTHGQFATVDKEDALILVQRNWNAWLDKKTGTFYPVASVKLPSGKWSTERMNRFLCPCPMALYVDHRNGYSLHNWKGNLRPATPAQNGWNRRVSGRSSIGLKGVSIRGKKFSSQITTNGVLENLGVYVCAADAHKAHVHAAMRSRGDFAKVH